MARLERPKKKIGVFVRNLEPVTDFPVMHSSFATETGYMEGAGAGLWRIYVGREAIRTWRPHVCPDGGSGSRLCRTDRSTPGEASAPADAEAPASSAERRRPRTDQHVALPEVPCGVKAADR
jgi:hypothetical protein